MLDPLNLIPFRNVLKPLKNGDRSGNGTFLVVTFGVANSATVFTHFIGRTPNIYLVVGSQQAGTVYGTSADIAAWTNKTVTLRASATGTYTIYVV